jgi:hypothetical protein
MGLRSLFQFIGGIIMLAVTSFYLFSLNLGLMALLILPIFAIKHPIVCVKSPICLISCLE